jgi:hypothetical protein
MWFERIKSISKELVKDVTKILYKSLDYRPAEPLFVFKVQHKVVQRQLVQRQLVQQQLVQYYKCGSSYNGNSSHELGCQTAARLVSWTGHQKIELTTPN